MTLDQLLNGQWLEFSGGSRPNSRRLRLARLADGEIELEIFYVFDHDTGEKEQLAFTIAADVFDQFTEELLATGSAVIDQATDTQRLSFECRTTDYGFDFRLKGSTNLSLGGP